MTLLQISYFYELAKNQNASLTASRLGIRQATLSQLISSLEKELGTVLFTRSRNSLRLNEDGRMFFSYVEKALFALENGKRAAADISPEKLNSVTFCGGSPFVWFDLLQTFEREHPGFHVRNIVTAETDFFQTVQSGIADLVIMGPNEFREPDYECIPLKDHRLFICVPPEHPLAGKEAVYLKDLKEETFIRLSSSSRLVGLCDKLLAEAGVKPKNIISCDYMSRPNLVTTGLGIAMTTARARAADLLKPNVYIPIADASAVWQLFICRNRRRYQSHAAAAFTEYMKEKLT